MNLVGNSMAYDNVLEKPISSVDEVTHEERFTRLEEKFFLPNSLREEFMQLVNHNLAPNYPDPATKYQLIESTYFDSAELRSLTDHFNKLSYRFKLRCRRYGPNGDWQVHKPAMFLELKTKTGDISDKMRMKIKPAAFEKLQVGGKIESEKKIKTTQRINEVLEECPLTPSCRVVYRRFAYEKNNVRLTIDDQLTFEPQAKLRPPLMEAIRAQKWWPQAEQMCKGFNGTDVSLVEVKHFGIIPLWLQNFMKEKNLAFTSFSKYCYSMVNLINKGNV